MEGLVRIANGDRIQATATPALFSDGSPLPGLYDVTTEDGREFCDLTFSQIFDVERRLGLYVQFR